MDYYGSLTKCNKPKPINRTSPLEQWEILWWWVNFHHAIIHLFSLFLPFNTCKHRAGDSRSLNPNWVREEGSTLLYISCLRKDTKEAEEAIWQWPVMQEGAGQFLLYCMVFRYTSAICGPAAESVCISLSSNNAFPQVGSLTVAAHFYAIWEMV